MNALPLLIEVYNRSGALVPRLGYNRLSLRDVYLVSIYGSAVEIAGEAIDLMSGKTRTSIPILVRAFLDVYVDLVNLANDERYTAQIEYEYLRSSVHQLELASQKGWTASPDEHSDQLAYAQSRLGKLVEDGAKHLTVRTKFQRAGMLEYYETLYRHYSIYAHSGLYALMERHRGIRSVGEVSIGREKSEEELHVDLNLLAGFLANASWIVHDCLETDAITEAQAVKEFYGSEVEPAPKL